MIRNKNLSPKIFRNSSSREQLNKKISEVAFGIYKKRNYAPGNDLADWLEAEKIVRRDS